MPYPFWTDATLIEILKEAEAQIVQEVPTVVERYCLNVFSGVSTYTLPNYVTFVRKVMWKGFQLDPAKMAHVIGSDSSPINNVAGRPREYVMDGYGSNVIKFFPPPNERLEATQDGLWDESIPDKLIIEYYRVVDPDSATLRIPSQIRDLVTFPYCLAKLFSQEGIYQDVRSAAFYANMSQQVVQMYKETLREIWAAWPKILSSEPTRPGKLKMPRPSLPAKFYDVS